MYIWAMDVEVEWHNGDDGLEIEAESYKVVAKNYLQAISKTEKHGLKKSRKFTQDDGEYYPVRIVDFTRIEQVEDSYLNA